MLAMMTRQPILQISPEESLALASAIVDLSKHYNLAVLSGPYAAWINLAAVAGMVYIPKVLVIKAQSVPRETAVMPATVEEAMAAAQVANKQNSEGAGVYQYQ